MGRIRKENQRSVRICLIPRLELHHRSDQKKKLHHRTCVCVEATHNSFHTNSALGRGFNCFQTQCISSSKAEEIAHSYNSLQFPLFFALILYFFFFSPCQKNSDKCIILSWPIKDKVLFRDHDDTYFISYFSLFFLP